MAVEASRDFSQTLCTPLHASAKVLCTAPTNLNRRRLQSSNYFVLFIDHRQSVRYQSQSDQFRLPVTATAQMLSFLDLPPEIRLIIYELLLVDPIRDGKRITFTVDLEDSTRTKWDRARCTQIDLSHNEGHSAGTCRLKVPPSTVHHLDFTDLMSLARTSKRLYAEASATMYNNADLAFSFWRPSIVGKTSKTTLGTMPLCLYLDQQSPITRTMFRSLVIEDSYCTMSPRDMATIVKISNVDMPQLRVFGIKSVGPSTAPWGRNRVNTYCMGICRALILVQPVAHLRSNIRTFLELPFLSDAFLNGPRMQPSVVPVQRYMRSRLMREVSQILKLRHATQKWHALALCRGDYLQATLALRSMSDTEAQT